MANEIKIILRVHPFVVRMGPNEGAVHYCVRRAGGISQVFNDSRLAARIQRSTTFTTSDIEGIIDAFKVEIRALLTEGHRVRLENFGTFFLGLSATSHDNPEDVSTSDVERIRVRFAPAKSFRFENAANSYTRHEGSVFFELRRDDGETEEDNPEPENGEDEGEIIDPDA